jgi:regulator of protease activity HflC (stomatin/prohibitin superfamily)
MSIIFTVPQSHCVIIERFGKFSSVKHQGLAFKLPVIDSIRRVSEDWGDVANKRGYLIELTEQQSDTGKRICQTHDNVTARIDAVVYWQILDPRAALYEVDHLPISVTDSALNTLRAEVGSMPLDKLFSDQEHLNELIATHLRKTTQKWGIIINRVEIQEIETDTATVDSMRQQMDAERKSRAMVLEAEGQAKSILRIAQAEKQATILKAEGDAKAKTIMAEAESQYLEKLMMTLPAKEAAGILIAQKYLEGFKEISRNQADKVFLPNSFQGIFSIDTNK